MLEMEIVSLEKPGPCSGWSNICYQSCSSMADYSHKLVGCFGVFFLEFFLMLGKLSFYYLQKKNHNNNNNKK